MQVRNADILRDTSFPVVDDYTHRGAGYVILLALPVRRYLPDYLLTNNEFRRPETSAISVYDQSRFSPLIALGTRGIIPLWL